MIVPASYKHRTCCAAYLPTALLKEPLNNCHFEQSEKSILLIAKDSLRNHSFGLLLSRCETTSFLLLKHCFSKNSPCCGCYRTLLSVHTSVRIRYPELHSWESWSWHLRFSCWLIKSTILPFLATTLFHYECSLPA